MAERTRRKSQAEMQRDELLEIIEAGIFRLKTSHSVLEQELGVSTETRLEALKKKWGLKEK